MTTLEYEFQKRRRVLLERGFIYRKNENDLWSAYVLKRGDRQTTIYEKALYSFDDERWKYFLENYK